MEIIPSFAGLAARLSAQAAELRPVDGSRDTVAKFAALVLCALLDLLVCVCADFDARAAMGVSPLAPSVSVPHAERKVRPGDKRAGSPSLVRKIRALARVSTTSPALVRLVVDNRGKLGHDGTGIFCSCAMAVSGASPLSPMAALPKNAVFRPAPTHINFVTI